MDSIEWDDRLTVGVEEVDNQHKEMIRIANVLFTSINNGEDKQYIRDIVDELRMYTEYHFESEQNHMRRSKYPRLDEHIELHDELVAKTKAIKLAIFRNDMDAASVKTYVKDWVMEHIIYHDLDFAKFLQDVKTADQAKAEEEDREADEEQARLRDGM